MIRLLGFLLAMWALVIFGGAAAVVVFDQFSTPAHDNLDAALTYAAKAAVAVSLVVAWVFFLSRIKNWAFQKQLRS